MIPTNKDAYRLLHDGAIALAQVESNGIAVDVPYIKKALKETNERVITMMREIEADPESGEVIKIWRATYGKGTNFEANEQLGKVLYEKMGFKPVGLTKKGVPRTDENAILTIKHPFISKFLEVKKLRKAAGTNLEGLLREVVDGYVHCFFNLHTTVTYRSSSNSFNFQNIPIRMPDIAKLIRRAFIAREGRQLVEIDFSGAEVRVSACYHKDPTMLEYLTDPKKDMHRDTAMRLFNLPESEISDPARQAAKNAFVFAQFYGDWYLSCAQGVWEQLERYKIATNSGTPLRKHLRSASGIRELGPTEIKQHGGPGTFIDHVKTVEHDFWNNMFPVYNQWKKDWYAHYVSQGYVDTLSGFTCRGYMKKNEVINYPVQGTSFHCLLWCMIEVMKQLQKRNMKTLIVGQIHDSLVADVDPSELDEYLEICRRIMVIKLQRHYESWMIIPMKADVSVAPVGGSWIDKKKYKLGTT